MLGIVAAMPIHPSPPYDLPGLVAAYHQTMQAVIDLGHECRPEDFDRPTSCPGWSLRDVLSHVAAVEASLEGVEQPEVELPERAHLRHDFAVWLEYGVQQRRSLSGQEVVAELESVLQHRLATLANPELTLETEVPAPTGGTRRLGSLLKLRLNDIWVHEQDVREALGHPGNLDSGGAAMFVQAIVKTFPGRIVEDVELPDGQTVILDSTGPVTARVGVRISHDEDGAQVGHALFAGATEPGEHHQHSADDPTTTIVLSTDALTRRAAGRRSTEDTAYRVVGDDDIARRVLDALVITP